MLEVAGATFHLAPTSANDFRTVSGPVDLDLRFAMDGEQPVMRVSQSGAEEIAFTRSSVDGPSIERMQEFTGSFYSPELDVSYVVELRDGELHVTRPGSDESPMRVVDNDEFTVAGWSVKFTRNETGRIGGFLLDAGRVRGLRFERR